MMLHILVTAKIQKQIRSNHLLLTLHLWWLNQILKFSPKISRNKRLILKLVYLKTKWMKFTHLNDEPLFSDSKKDLLPPIVCRMITIAMIQFNLAPKLRNFWLSLACCHASKKTTLLGQLLSWVLIKLAQCITLELTQLAKGDQTFEVLGWEELLSDLERLATNLL